VYIDTEIVMHLQNHEKIKKDLWKESTDNDVQLFPTLLEVGIAVIRLYTHL
jgi:hypothetical protein